MSPLFFDTETTGLPDFKKPASDPSHPHIVQLGAILYDDARHVVSEINLLVRPEGWTIPAEASAVHGITQEAADKYGLPLASVMLLFLDLCARADLIVAHNHSFDEKMIRREWHHLGNEAVAETFRKIPSFCTMKATTDICKLPGKYGYKWPKMQEAYRHFFGKDFEGAHDAMADVRACAAVYWAINPLLTVEPNPDPEPDYSAPKPITPQENYEKNYRTKVP